MVLGTDSVTTSTATSESAPARSESVQGTESESVHARFEAAQAPTPTSVHRPSARAGERWAYQWVDNRLKVLSVFVPAGFLVALELVRYSAIRATIWRSSRSMSRASCPPSAWATATAWW